MLDRCSSCEGNVGDSTSGSSGGGFVGRINGLGGAVGMSNGRGSGKMVDETPLSIAKFSGSCDGIVMDEGGIIPSPAVRAAATAVTTRSICQAASRECMFMSDRQGGFTLFRG